MNIDTILNELQFKAVRSSGAGGQNVNKVSSKVEVSFNVLLSNGLDDAEKLLLQNRLTSKLTKEGILILNSSETRSQHKNKTLAIEKLLNMLRDNLKVNKARKKSKPSESMIEKRLKKKKEQALKKQNRKPPLY